MPQSLKSKLSKLKHKGQITEEEYKELINKVDGHDAELYTQAYSEGFKEGHGYGYEQGYAEGFADCIDVNV